MHKIRIGVIGMGHNGKFHADHLLPWQNQPRRIFSTRLWGLPLDGAA